MRQAAAALIGHTVSYLDKNGDTQTGIASSVSYAGAVPIVTIGDEKIALDSILGVVSPADTPGTTPPAATPPATAPTA